MGHRRRAGKFATTVARAAVAAGYDGKILIDAMNYWQPVDGNDPELVTAAGGTSTVVQQRFHAARVVKSFNQHRPARPLSGRTDDFRTSGWSQPPTTINPRRAPVARAPDHVPQPPSSPPDPDRSTGVLVIAGPVADDAAVRAVCERLRAVMSTTSAPTIVVDAGALPANYRSIEVLVRLQLTARRASGRVRLRGASPPLRHLLEFAGLADVVPVCAHDP